MNMMELLAWYMSLGDSNPVRFEQIEDTNGTRVLKNGRWQKIPGIWDIFQKDGKWYFLLTDHEDGSVWSLRPFATEEEAASYARHALEVEYTAWNGGRQEEEVPAAFCAV